MDSRFINSPFLTEQEDFKSSPENSDDSPHASMLNESKMASTSSPKRSRRAIQKRVVSVPIKDVDGSRLKGEMSAPPADSWAWRKYGQKPIKGSPHPRGYYRCSSSKGCPARKQVERSRDDPNMLVVTYSCEHNHPRPAARNHHPNHNRHNTTSTPTTTNVTKSKSKEEEEEEEEEKPAKFSRQQEENSDAKFGNLGEASLVSDTEFGWFTDLIECSSSTILESPILADERVSDDEKNMFCSIREEDESLFADLGELPGCSMVFHRGMMERDEECRRHSSTPWCGTTG